MSCALAQCAIVQDLDGILKMQSFLKTPKDDKGLAVLSYEYQRVMNVVNIKEIQKELLLKGSKSMILRGGPDSGKTLLI